MPLPISHAGECINQELLVDGIFPVRGEGFKCKYAECFTASPPLRPERGADFSGYWKSNKALHTYENKIQTRYGRNVW